MKVGISLDLDSGEEQSTVQEDPVAFPLAGIVVRLSVDGSWYRPDGSSSHFFPWVLSKLIIIIGR